MLVDFHTHTTGSDGTYTPNTLLNLAKNRKIEILSITDHDCLDGIKSIENIPPEILFVPGIEISAEFPKTLHILGYKINIDDYELNNTLKMLQEYRKSRNYMMIEKMQKFGFNISINELVEEAKGELIGRPHFANLMVKKGYVKTYQEAFDKYLKKGGPLYLDKKRLEPEKAIELIHNAGGVAILAHPYQTGLEGENLEKLVKKLKSHGLDGIEVYYSKHTPRMIEEYETLAKKFDLLITAGSDFHGKNKPDIELGMEINFKEIKDFIFKLL